jgi:hypothetical protein
MVGSYINKDKNDGEGRPDEMEGNDVGPFVVPKNESGVVQSAGTVADPVHTKHVDSNGKVEGEVGYVGPVVQVGSFPALDKDTDSVTTIEETTATFGHGIATVDAAGTDEPISATPLAVKWVIFQAIPGQAGNIALGGAGVDATASTGTGIVLYEGDSVSFGPCDLADVYQDATITGNGVRYTYGV